MKKKLTLSVIVIASLVFILTESGLFLYLLLAVSVITFLLVIFTTSSSGSYSKEEETDATSFSADVPLIRKQKKDNEAGGTKVVSPKVNEGNTQLSALNQDGKASVQQKESIENNMYSKTQDRHETIENEQSESWWELVTEPPEELSAELPTELLTDPATELLIEPIPEPTQEEREIYPEPAKEEKVPYWPHHYVYSANDLNSATPEQRRFYRLFKKKFLQGEYVDLNDNSNYAFVLLFDLLEDYRHHKDLHRVQEELRRLGEQYPGTQSYTFSSLKKTLEDTLHRNRRHTTLAGTNRPSKTGSLPQLCRWVSAGEEVEIQGYTIRRGNFYLGEMFLLPEKFRDEGYNSRAGSLYGPVINPDLEIVKGTKEMSFFYSYQEMSPALRGYYLKWLAGKVPEEETPIEFLEIYLLGFELRLFVDTHTKQADREEIIREMIRLREALKPAEYHYYREALTRCIDAAVTCYFYDSPLTVVSADQLHRLDMYFSRMMGDHFKKHGSMDCETAYRIDQEWLCEKEMRAPAAYQEYAYGVFSKEFQKRHGDGLKVNVHSYKQTYYLYRSHSRDSMYYPENHSFSVDIFQGYVEKWTLSNHLRLCHDKVYHAFYAYNKALMRNQGKVTLDVLFQLPKKIDLSGQEKVRKLLDFLEAKTFEEDYPQLVADEVFAFWEYEFEEDFVSKYHADSVLEGLDEYYYGVEPDYRISGPRLKRDTVCIVFRKSRKSPVEKDAFYARMQAMVKMAVVLIQADGACSTPEDELMVKMLQTHVTNPSQRKYLTAHYHYLKLEKQKYTGFKQYPALFTEEQVEGLYQFLIQLACVDGEITSKEIKNIQKTMAYFGVNGEDIHARIHRLYTGEQEVPVTVMKQTGAKEYAIPKPQQVKPTFSIDTDRLSAIEQDTQKSKALLSDIFASEEEPESEVAANGKQPDKLIQILEILLTQEAWSRAEVEALCSERNLMIGSVLESINDYAYEKVEDAVVEDEEDTIYVITQYKEQLL